MKECYACKEEIKDKAVKCRHCSAIQGWMRLLSAPIVITGLVLTIVSIYASEPIKKFLDPKSAVIEAVIPSGNFHQISITLTNEGTRTATLLNFKIEGRTNQGRMTSYRLKSDLDGKLIEPGKPYAAIASNSELIPSFIERMRSAPLKEMHGFKENCRLLIDYVDFNGQELIKPFPFMCDPLDSDPRPGLPITTEPRGIPLKLID
ncbi:hypothetical protein J1G18_07475 [Pseudomonas sp. MIS38]|uniref:hypothetical protein n=1 Tax=Pseudomonas sp. MIS38 TaxID=91465 RepID=UPI001CA6B551|nr:hypothetical protein [Pseudomonas sp. MIS38]MBY8957122.1 hypothetical protein [Pseudomonas sp. MIS38]